MPTEQLTSSLLAWRYTGKVRFFSLSTGKATWCSSLPSSVYPQVTPFHPTQLHGWPSVSETPCSSNKVGATLTNKTASTFPGPNMAAKPTAPEARLSVMFLCLPCTQPVILPQLLCPFASHSTWWQAVTREEIQYFFPSSHLSTWPCAFSACCSDPVAITIITYLTRFSLVAKKQVAFAKKQVAFYIVQAQFPLKIQVQLWVFNTLLYLRGTSWKYKLQNCKARKQESQHHLWQPGGDAEAVRDQALSTSVTATRWNSDTYDLWNFV